MAHRGVVVAHWGSCGGSLGSSGGIGGVESLDVLPSGMVPHRRLSSEVRQRRRNKKKGLWFTKNNYGEKKLEF
jgi:hypothetical protein